MPEKDRVPSDQFLKILSMESISFKHGYGHFFIVKEAKGITTVSLIGIIVVLRSYWLGSKKRRNAMALFAFLAV